MDRLAMTMVPLLFAGLLASTSQAQPAAANCTQARTETERAICRLPALRTLDGKLGAAFTRLLSELGNPAAQRAVRANQKAWLADRDRCGDTEPCLREAMAQRLAWLEAPLTAVSGLYSNGAYSVLVTLNDQSFRPTVRLYTGNALRDDAMLLMESEARWIEANDPAGEGEAAVVFRPLFSGAARAFEKACTQLRLTFFMDDLLSLQGSFKGVERCPWLLREGKAAGQTDYKLVKSVYDYTGPVR